MGVNIIPLKTTQMSYFNRLNFEISSFHEDEYEYYSTEDHPNVIFSPS